MYSDLDNFIFDNNIERQKEALDAEYDRYENGNQAEQDAIDAVLDTYEKAHQAKIDMIDAEIEARQAQYDNEIAMIEDTLEAQQQNHDDLIDDINNEIEARQAQHDNDIAQIDAQMEARQNRYDATIDQIDKENAAYESMINAKIEGLRLEGEEYDRQMEDKRQQIDDLQSTIENNGKLTRDAYARISEEMNTDADAFRDKLIKYNDEFGTGISEDITEPWRRFGEVTVDNYDYLSKMKTTMSEISTITSDLARQQATVISQAQTISGLQGTYTSGIRNYFESYGNTVDWDDATKQFSINGNWFDSSDYVNFNGSLQATYDQLVDLEERLKNLPQHKKGGYIPEDELAIIHGGERVLSKEENDAYESGKQSPIDFSTFSLTEFGNMLIDNLDMNLERHNSSYPVSHSSLLNVVNNNQNQQEPPVNIENNFNGVTSESFMRDLPKIMKTAVDKGITELKLDMNNVARAHGLVGGVGIR